MRSREKKKKIEKRKRRRGTNGDDRGTDERSAFKHLYRGRIPHLYCMVCTG
jgi:hypothetical protein